MTCWKVHDPATNSWTNPPRDVVYALDTGLRLPSKPCIFEYHGVEYRADLKQARAFCTRNPYKYLDFRRGDGPTSPSQVASSSHSRPDMPASRSLVEHPSSQHRMHRVSDSARPPHPSPSECHQDHSPPQYQGRLSSQCGCRTPTHLTAYTDSTQQPNLAHVSSSQFHISPCPSGSRHRHPQAPVLGIVKNGCKFGLTIDGILTSALPPTEMKEVIKVLIRQGHRVHRGTMALARRYHRAEFIEWLESTAEDDELFQWEHRREMKDGNESAEFIQCYCNQIAMDTHDDLHRAVAADDLDLLKRVAFTATQAEMNAAASDNPIAPQSTPLGSALLHNSLKCTFFLLGHDKVSTDFCPDGARTALRFCARLGLTDAVNVMLHLRGLTVSQAELECLLFDSLNRGSMETALELMQHTRLFPSID